MLRRCERGWTACATLASSEEPSLRRTLPSSNGTLGDPTSLNEPRDSKSGMNLRPCPAIRRERATFAARFQRQSVARKCSNALCRAGRTRARRDEASTPLACMGFLAEPPSPPPPPPATPDSAHVYAEARGCYTSSADSTWTPSGSAPHTIRTNVRPLQR
jgi:hypothetical protein